MKRFGILAFSVLLAAATLTGCSSSRMHSLTDQEFAPTRPADVRMFLGKSNRPHMRLAYINSFIDGEKTVSVKRRQLEDLRNAAAEVGADAVVDIQLLKEKHKGMVADPAVPFAAWQQGKFELYFLRGTAIRFTEQADEKQPVEWEQEQAGVTAPSAEEGKIDYSDVEKIPERELTEADEEERAEEIREEEHVPY